ncbi:deoxyguanosinetriphosphate triphosphohydrolase, partial [Escherichia coli]|nr:deoxyguanosinetriphosphate triphosphohydrolase [Escherichia coli]
PRAAATAGKFIYDDDYYFYINLLAENQLDLNPGEKTIDAQIMDLADEIAYAAHDLEDALSRNMVTIEDIEYEFQISDEFRGAREQFREIVTQSRNTAFQANLLKTSEEFAIIFRKELTSNIVNRLVADISVVTNLNGFQELGFGKLNALS